jgi:hypothetical protein
VILIVSDYYVCGHKNENIKMILEILGLGLYFPYLIISLSTAIRKNFHIMLQCFQKLVNHYL